MNELGINNLGNYRFSITMPYNAGAGWNLAVPWGPEYGAFMDLTYQQLVDSHRVRLCGDIRDDMGRPILTQSMRNQLSTLHGFLASVGKTVDSRVGAELSSAFEAKARDYLASLQVSSKTKNDRRSHLRAWRDTVNALVKTRSARETPCDSLFHARLRQVLSETGEYPKTLAKRCGASPSALGRWLRGAIPNRRALPSLHRLESLLGLERGELASLVPWGGKEASERQACNQAIPTPSIGYRKRQKARAKSHYVLKDEEVDQALEAEWQAFFTYKTARITMYKRSTRGVWSMVPAETAPRNLSPKAWRGEMACSAADVNWKYISQFLGYVRLDTTAGGAGLPMEDRRTLALLAVPELVNGYLEFVTTRSGGLVHRGQKLFAAFVASLVNREHGYLLQQPRMHDHLSSKVLAGRTWETLCAQSHEVAMTWKRDANDISRKPEEPIQQLLNLEDPLRPVLAMVDTLDSLALKCSADGIQEARGRRDALLIAMLIANPLRLRQFANMRWHPDNSGNLYRTSEGQWRLRFNSGDLKNGKSASKRGYDAPLPAWLSARIEAYLEDFRPALIAGDKDKGFVFPSSRGGGVWKHLGRHVAKLTRRHIPGCPGFGPHAFRHLVATNWLRQNPNDYLTVAELLNDSLNVVLANYAHLRKDDSFGRYETYINSMRGRGP